ncbi:hypothetical protein B1F79_05045 [Coxiella-like endosymbiont of Rhipicephalus sanguineus]|nr:hypothetical protein [Coxiella-like endosymbiont of Rhipicephalus sanguineus]
MSFFHGINGLAEKVELESEGRLYLLHITLEKLRRVITNFNSILCDNLFTTDKELVVFESHPTNEESYYTRPLYFFSIMITKSQYLTTSQSERISLI